MVPWAYMSQPPPTIGSAVFAYIAENGAEQKITPPPLSKNNCHFPEGSAPHLIILYAIIFLWFFGTT